MGGNTGGNSGDYFDTVTIGASVTSTFATAAAFHGGLGWQIVQPGTGAITYNEWSAQMGTVTTPLWGRFYWKGGWNSTTHDLAHILNGATVAAKVEITSGGFLRVIDQAAVSTTGTFAVANGIWYRIEWLVAPGTGATNVLEASVYFGDDQTPRDLIGVSTATTQTQFTVVRIGHPSVPASSATTSFDDLSISTDGPIGSVVRRVSPVRRMPLGV